ncbi:MAG TPA: DUF3817 domain-containing protein [Cyclobacteriaceae bacterium]|nr:DUF3817 domain-containing protein [Cyclobacteriaceae bacterium]
MINNIKSLRWIGIAEGISFLVLLLIAMPLKYQFDWPWAVKYVGWAHGLLFMLYVIAVFAAIKAMNWGLKGIALALLASLVPAGTFVLDKSLKKRQEELKVNR